MSPKYDAPAQEVEPAHFGPGSDLENEFITLRKAAEELPGLRSGKRVHPGTLHRWRLQGLRTVTVGATICTTRRWLREFFESRSGGCNAAPDPAPRSPSRRAREIARADAELAALGV